MLELVRAVGADLVFLTILVENHKFDLVVEEGGLLDASVILKSDLVMHVDLMEVDLDALVVHVEDQCFKSSFALALEKHAVEQTLAVLGCLLGVQGFLST